MSTSRPRGTASLTERALLLAAKNDYPHALDELLGRYEPLIGAIVASLCLPCGCERADLAQEARLGLACAIRAWQPARGPFPAFAALCARNRALRALDAAGARKHQLLSRARSLDDHQPRAKARLSLVKIPVPASDALEPGESLFHVPLGEQLASTSSEADPVRTVIARAKLDAVLAALPTLTPLERLVLAATVNDKSQRRLAAELGCSRRTVRSALRSAREKLATQLALAA